MRKESKFGILYFLGIVERENNPEMKLVFDVNLKMFSRNKIIKQFGTVKPKGAL